MTFRFRAVKCLRKLDGSDEPVSFMGGTGVNDRERVLARNDEKAVADPDGLWLPAHHKRGISD